MNPRPYLLFWFTVLLCTCVRAQTVSWPEVSIDLPYAATLQPRTTHDITGGPWSVGGETMDRDYTIYDNWKGYVEDLGIKRVRLQSGWAKTEKERGEYDFAWMDSIVYDLKEKGVEPWISISYGNALYKGGGGQRLGARLPTSGEAYTAWQAYVRALVTRYRDVVDTWEVWNEPNNKWQNHEGDDSGANGPADYGKFLIATGEIIRDIQPDATIIGFALAGMPLDWTGMTLAYLAEHDPEGKYLDLLSYHPYRMNPDEVYGTVAQLQDSIAKYRPGVSLYQGENGAPSEFRNTKALRKYEWTELSQAKWFLRRALGDWGRGIETSLFSIVDLKYPDEINRKGLLLIDDDKRVLRPKHAYHAVRHMVSVFDEGLSPTGVPDYRADTYHDLEVFGFRRGQAPLVALWFSDNTPSDHNGTTAVDFTFTELDFTDPVYVDLRTGVVYELPASHHRVTEAGHEFYDLPVYDSPVLIAERSAVGPALASR
jgi:hypothetical protein